MLLSGRCLKHDAHKNLTVLKTKRMIYNDNHGCTERVFINDDSADIDILD